MTSSKPREWHTSDRHIGHRRCATEWRGFNSIEAHGEYQAARFAELVGPRDRLTDHGDEALSYSERNLELLARTPGVKHLIPGNHSPVHPMNRKAGTPDDAWERMLAKARSVYRTITMLDHIKLPGGQVVMLSHLPYEGDHRPDDRHQRWRPRDEGDWLLCGHVHGEWLIRGHQVNVGVDQWGMGPVPRDILLPVLNGSVSPSALCKIRDEWVGDTGGRRTA